jgi:thiamine transport system ATP-binding protein
VRGAGARTRPGLHVDNVTVTFGATTAVDAATLSVAPGEVMALLGPSGCGKSTLLRAVAGLQPLHRGAVAWDGDDLAGVAVHRRGFGLMFQDGQLFPHRDVAGNVDFGLRMTGVARPERAARVVELLALVGLSGREHRSVQSLSGGEQQRVALARALAPRPRLLLLDEPLTSLDRPLRDRLSGELAAILRGTSTTALYVTHDHDEAFTVADQVTVMDQGRLLQTAPPEQLWRCPRDEKVARLLGYRWFVPSAALGPTLSNGVPPGTVLALRAESLAVDPDGPLAGTVVTRRFTRGGTTLQVAVDDVDGLGTVESWTPGSLRPQVGARVRLRLEPAATALLGR